MKENKLQIKKLSENISFNYYNDVRFKRNRISINIILPLDKKNAALNALVINILKNGCKNIPNYSQINQKLEILYGAGLNCSVDKKGKYQILNISTGGIDNRYALANENIISELSNLLIDLLLNPLIIDNKFNEKYVEIEKKQLIDLIESEINEKRTYAINQTTKIMYGEQLNAIPKYGYKEDVINATNEDLVKAYHNILENGNIQIMFIGSGDSNIAYSIFEKSFKPYFKNTTLSLKAEALVKSNQIKEKTEKMDVNQGKLVLGFTSGVQNNDNAIDALRILTAIYGSTPFSKLFVNVREKLSLCYYCAARFDKSSGIMLVDSGVEFDNINKAKAEILNQLELLKQGEFTQDEMDNAVLSIKNSLNSVYDSTSALETFYLAQLFYNNISTVEEELNKLDKITKEDIITAAKYFNLDTVYVLKGEGSND